MADALKLQLTSLLLNKVTSTDKIIGRGAYGRVIEVYVHGTLCAAKETHPSLIENVSAQESETIRRSFCEECVKASRIHHPNIVQMLGIYYPTPQAKLPWLVMEMMQTSLKDFLEEHVQGKVPLHFKLSMLVDVAQGLEFLHGQDIIHRDLSSNNVLLTKNLVAKIADLGVAKVVQDNKMKTHTQAPGTTHFMPPEALLNKPCYGKPVDVFSLACVALQVMSHQWPEPKDRVSEDTMTVLTEIQRRDKYMTFCTLPALKELVELCLHNKSEQRPDISVVCVKLKELKVTIEKQVPFATDSRFELLDVVRQTQLQNQKLSATNKRLTESLQAKCQKIRLKNQQIPKKDKQIQEKDKQIHEKDKQVQEKDKQIQEKDKQIREKDKQIQEKDKQIQEKDNQIKKLQIVNPSTQPLPDIKENVASRKPLNLSALPPPDYGENDEFGSVPLHINPSSHFDDDDHQLIKDSTHLGYRNPPESKSQMPPGACLAGYPPVTGDYKASDWPPRTTVPAVASYNRDTEFDKNTEFDKTHLEISRHGQHQHVGAGYPPVTGGYTPSDWPPSTTGPAVAPHNRDAHVSRQGQHQHVVAGYPPVTATRPSDWPPPTTIPAVTSRNRDPEFDISRRGQYQHVGARGLRNKSFDDSRLLSIPDSDTTKAGGLHSLPSGSMSTSTGQFGSSSSRLYKRQTSVDSSLSGGSDRLAPLDVGTTPNSNQITGSDSSPVTTSVPLTEPIPEVSQTQAPDSKYGKTNLNALKNRFQNRKEVTQILAPASGPGAQSQSSSNYANVEMPYQLVSDKSGAGKTDLTSLRTRLEKAKEEREKTLAAVGNKKSDDYYNVSDVTQLAAVSRMAYNPPDKKPIATPRTLTPANLASKELSISSNRSYLLWQCAGCETVNDLQNTYCKHCKLPQGEMADRSHFCEYCKLMIFIPLKAGCYKYTYCPQCTV